MEKQVYAPKVIRKKHRGLFIGIAIVLALSIALMLYHRPRTYTDQGTAALTYTSGDTSYLLLLRNSKEDFFHKDAQPLYEREMTKDLNFAVPLQLYVYNTETMENAAESFRSLLKSSAITCETLEGDAVPEIVTPGFVDRFPYALEEADILCVGADQVNRLTWTLELVNGDKLTLHETISIKTLPQLIYSYRDTPLQTSEELQALLDSIAGTASAEFIIELAPVTYEGEIRVKSQYLTLVGTADDTARTTFTGPLLIEEDLQNPVNLEGILFAGSGDGIGIQSGVSVFASGCVFSDYAVGIDGLDGCWPILFDCTFTDCDIAVRVDSTRSISRSALFYGLVMERNGIAIQMIRTPGDETLYFQSCTFTDNEVDFDIQSGNPVEIW